MAAAEAGAAGRVLQRPPEPSLSTRPTRTASRQVWTTRCSATSTWRTCSSHSGPAARTPPTAMTPRRVRSATRRCRQPRVVGRCSSSTVRCLRPALRAALPATCRRPGRRSLLDSTRPPAARPAAVSGTRRRRPGRRRLEVAALAVPRCLRPARQRPPLLPPPPASPSRRSLTCCRCSISRPPASRTSTCSTRRSSERRRWGERRQWRPAAARPAVPPYIPGSPADRAATEQISHAFHAT